MIQKIFNFFNIQLQPYQGPLALSMFISVLLHAYFGPVICKTTITELPSQWLAFEGVWCCTASLLIGMVWKGSFRILALKSFIWFAIAETIAGVVLAMWLVLVTWNVWVYSIFSLLYVSLVSLTIGRCVMVFKTKIWNEKSRELHDNTAAVVRDLALIIGGIAAMLFCPSLKLALILWGIANVVDDIGWIIIWFKLKDKLKEN